MAVQTNDEIKGTEKEFLDLFNHLCYSRTAWQVWSDLMSAMACTIANVFETNPKRKADREKEYERCIKELGGDVRHCNDGIRKQSGSGFPRKTVYAAQSWKSLAWTILYSV